MRQRIVYHVIRWMGSWEATFRSYEKADTYRKTNCPMAKIVPEAVSPPGVPLY